MVRVYHEDRHHDGMAPRTFGPVARFDPHVRDGHQKPREDPHGRGALYLAADLSTGLAESYPEQWPEVSICPHARAGWVRPTKSVPLLDLTGEGALAISELDGIRYQAAHQGGECIVLWERASALQRLAGGDRRLWTVWSRVVVALAPQRRTPRRIAATSCPRCREAGFVS